MLATRWCSRWTCPTVASLLVNPDAKIRKETLDRIVEEAEEIESLACAAGVARRPLGPRHPAHRRFCRRLPASNGWRRGKI